MFIEARNQEWGNQVNATRGSTFSEVLQFLTNFPHPDAVAQAIVRGPLAQFGCNGMSIWLHVNFTELVCVGVHGLDDGVMEHYARLPLTFGAPVTESVISSSKIILPVSAVVKNYPGLGLDWEIWEALGKDNGNGDVAHVPIFANGIPIGAFAFLCDRSNEWNNYSIALLDGIAASLALWISNPLSKILDESKLGYHGGLVLSPRQIEILNLVRQGKSNASISARLGYSLSTVKQELQRVMKRLKVQSRDTAVERAIELQLLPTETPH